MLKQKGIWGESMFNKNREIGCFENSIREAVKSLKSNEYFLCKKYIGEAMLLNDHAPEVYNLLGIISEIKGDLTLAGKYYRVSYTFEPTYKPAIENLERITSFFYIFNKNSLNYGDQQGNEEDRFYFIEYAKKKIRHLKHNQKSKELDF